jgi:Iap family predicted aminopeptidase
MFTILLFWCMSVAAQNLNYQLASPDIIKARLDKYVGDDQQREATLKQLFSEVGCDQHLYEQPVKGSKSPNVICVLPGNSDKAVIVGAHFDHFSKGDGVVDDWSGASLLPSLYQGLKSDTHKHTYIFIGFTDSEKGLGEVGSRFYARHMTKEEVHATEAMVNLDVLGLDHPVIWGIPDRPLAALLVSVGKQLNVEVSTNQPSNFIFDTVAFSERNIPVITVHSLTQDALNANIFQTPKDKMSALRFENYYQTYKLLAVYLVALDQLRGTYR